MPPLTVMFKTVSSDCNLNCSYCYYRCSVTADRARHRLDPAVLTTFMPQYMDYVADTGQAHLSWQGGEPLLAGKEFFELIVDLEAKYARSPLIISNAIQTNGTLVDDKWADFFARYHFLVGVSLDGPEELHDRERLDAAGRGTFRRVMEGIGILRKHNVAVNVLSVLASHNIGYALQLLELYSEQRLQYIQFMPAMNFQSSEPDLSPTYLVNATEYGRFLLEVFEKWYGDGLPRFSVRTFDNFLQSYLGLGNDLCVYSESCNAGIVIEYNGDVYPCDFYIHPDYRLGNILQQPLREILKSPILRVFTRQKNILATKCRDCKWIKICHGECPRNRVKRIDGTQGVSYFCQCYREFFPKVDSRLQILAEKLRNYRHFLSWQSKRSGRTDQQIAPHSLCPCGSGHIHQDCCGPLTFIKDCYLYR